MGETQEATNTTSRDIWSLFIISVLEAVELAQAFIGLHSISCSHTIGERYVLKSKEISIWAVFAVLWVRFEK